jgi:protein-disulfide isomerase
MLSTPVGQTDHVLGRQGAHVTVVEYGDFECQYCHLAYGGVKILLSRYHDRVRFVYRHFPLSAWHPLAEGAAEAAEAAGAQHKFWPMYQQMFEQHHGLKPAALRQYAAALELDMERYDYDMKAHTYLQRVREHQQSGLASHVRGTPGFFVNGVIQDVTFGMEHLDQAIAAALRA